jgi:hypothetical protein
MTEISKGEEKIRMRWSLKTSFWMVFTILLVTSAFVLCLMQKAVWIELETLAVIAGVLLSLFYTYILYHGVVFVDDRTVAVRKSIGSPFDISGVSNLGDMNFGSFAAAGASDGIGGMLLGLLLDIVVTIFLAFVLSFLAWLGVNLVVESVALISIPLVYIFKRSLAFVLRHTEECRGNPGASLKYGFAYGAFKTATLCLIIFASHRIATVTFASSEDRPVREVFSASERTSG